MAKSLFEQMGGTYSKVGDYMLPDLLPPQEDDKAIGLWGQRHARYLKQHRRVLYMNLLTSGKLNNYLADIDEQAKNLFCRLVKQMADHEGVTEELKAENAMLWIGRINEIQARAREIINAELIYN